MQYDQFKPYYKIHSDPALLAAETMQEREWEQMTSYYSDTTARIFQAVADRCQRLDYEGSWIFDTYPDVGTLRALTDDIRGEIEGWQTDSLKATEEELAAQARSDDFLDDLIRVLLIQEIARRRCRNQRCDHFDSRRPNRRKYER